MFHRLRPLRRPLAAVAAGGTAFVASQLIDNRPALSAEAGAGAEALLLGPLGASGRGAGAVRARASRSTSTSGASRGARVAQICYGDDHGAALDDRGALWVWGGDAGAAAAAAVPRVGARSRARRARCTP